MATYGFFKGLPLSRAAHALCSGRSSGGIHESYLDKRSRNTLGKYGKPLAPFSPLYQKTSSGDAILSDFFPGIPLELPFGG
jgi:hypothetical protein